METKPTPAAIRHARAENPKMRERDLAQKLGICEAELVAAFCGETAFRIEPRVNDLLSSLQAVGEVMALTRNESAVHEKIGVYEKVVTGKHNALVLGAEIDLRIFPGAWKHGFAVEKRDGDEIRRSLQFFDGAGDAVHKIHMRPRTNLHAWQNLVDSLAASDQSQTVSTVPAASDDEAQEGSASSSPEELRERWSSMTDVHQFFGILRSLKLTRRQAVHMIGQDYAWPLETDAVATMMRASAETALPIMCFVGNLGCIQIHSGPIHEIRPMGPWLNVMDPTFHLHLRLDHIREVWAVRKPTKDGHVTSVEAYDAAGGMIIQFFGKRHEGEEERAEWRTLVEGLPRLARQTAATAA